MDDKRITVKGINSNYTKQEYEEHIKNALENTDAYWANVGKELEWVKPFSKISNYSYAKDNVYIKWYEDGILNASYNCLDVHVKKGNGDKIAILWESNNLGYKKSITYKELLEKTSQTAHLLQNIGVQPNDVVTIYMPNMIEAVYTMLACSRIGAIHSVVFSGFSPKALAERIVSCHSQYIITSDCSYRGEKKFNLKMQVEEAIKIASASPKAIIVASYNDGIQCTMKEGRDIHLQQEIKNQPKEHTPKPRNATDTLFVLYTSGSTNKPKGVMHATGGYLAYVKHTFKHSFDYKNSDVHFTFADIGWITGHSYMVYAPLLNGATILMYDGLPIYPDTSRLWQLCEQYKVSILYTAPTLIRGLMKEGNEPVKKHNLSTLRILGSVGEPINQTAWQWYFEVIGQKRCPIVDTWWQTETGGHMITPIPYVFDLKPSKASRPFFGIKAVILDNNGKEITTPNVEGALCFKNSWPGQTTGLYNNASLFAKTYFSKYPGHYFSGDAAYKDKDGYFRITGRMDDVLNVAGHLISTANLESVINSHKHVSESAIVGVPDSIKGEGIYAFVVAAEKSDTIKTEIIDLIRRDVGAIATPKNIQLVPDLPKTRSGKIMRRILKKLATNDTEALGDTSTLANPEVIEQLMGILKIKIRK